MPSTPGTPILTPEQVKRLEELILSGETWDEMKHQGYVYNHIHVTKMKLGLLKEPKQFTERRLRWEARGGLPAWWQALLV